MKDSIILTILLLTIFIFTGCKDNESKEVLNVNIIPQPAELKINKGNFRLNEQTQIIVNSDNQEVQSIANYFLDQFNTVSGYSLKISHGINATDNAIEFTDKNTDETLGEEGYTLKSNSDKIILSGTENGLFYAVQTLFQLLPSEIYSSEPVENIDWLIPSVEIKDKPRFAWRGMHLDVGRHMFPVSFIKKYIDYIALHKMNIFHWHLTEDQGWRIEIKKYPLLTAIGSKRKGSQIPKSKEIDTIPYGGFYTQDEIRDVVAYAEKKFVTIIPEIEFPGHSIAALSGYPELSCSGGPFEVRTKWGISDDIYCAGNEKVFTFAEDVLTEVLELFPSKYIHIGGDEAPKTRWKTCAKCQKRIKENGLKDEHELQNYFISRIEKFLNSKGRKIIGWDEILEGGLAPNAAVMSWRGIEGGVIAAKLKHNVVMTPSDYTYFCWYQGKPENEPPALGGFLPLEQVYNYEPIPEELTAEEQQYIMGVQACLWTENVDTPELAEYMLLPRLSALSEIAWSSKENRNLEDFLSRMQAHYNRLDQLGVNYRWPGLKDFTKKNVFINETLVEFIPIRLNTEIHYTTDGTTPTKNSTLYTKPFIITGSVKIQLIEIANGKRSPVYKTNYMKEEPLESIEVNGNKTAFSFKYYKLPKSIQSVKALKKLIPSQNGTIKTLKFPFKDSELPADFGLIFNGYIKVPETGLYTFYVLSNDGSHLFLGNKLVVDNDGEHGAYEKSGKIALQAGTHQLELLYFQAGGGKDLKVFWEGPGFEKKELTKENLTNN